MTNKTRAANPYEDGLPRTAANFAPLTPLVFLARTAEVYPEHPSVIHGETRYTWAQTYARCRRLASALAKRGVSSGDTVSIIAPMPATVLMSPVAAGTEIAASIIREARLPKRTPRILIRFI